MLYFLCLYASLADPNFTVRETASARILYLVEGWPHLYGPRIVELAAKASDPETMARVQVPVKAYQRWRVSSYRPPAGVPVYPLCDCYPVRGTFGIDYRDRSYGSAWLRRPAIEADADKAPYWRQYRVATERMAHDMLLAGDTEAEVDSLLRRMWALEVADQSDCSTNGERIPPMLQWETWKRLGWRGGIPTPEWEAR